jgi:hypothetical protein
MPARSSLSANARFDGRLPLHFIFSRPYPILRYPTFLGQAQLPELSVISKDKKITLVKNIVAIFDQVRARLIADKDGQATTPFVPRRNRKETVS